MMLTVFYDDGFWVGVVEDQEADRIRACRYIFGAEPHDAEVLEFIYERMMPLMENTSKTASAKAKERRALSPKRVARQRKKCVSAV